MPPKSAPKIRKKTLVKPATHVVTYRFCRSWKSCLEKMDALLARYGRKAVLVGYEWHEAEGTLGIFLAPRAALAAKTTSTPHPRRVVRPAAR
jgi:hypothetical protein